MNIKRINNEFRSRNFLTVNRIESSIVKNEFIKSDPLNWKKLKLLLRSKSSNKDILKHFDKFYAICSKLFGSEKETDYVSLLTVEIFKSFLCEKNISIALKKQIITKYGLSENDTIVIDELFDIVRSIEPFINDDILEQLKESNEYNLYEKIYALNPAFGVKIKVNNYSDDHLRLANEVFDKYWDKECVFEKMTIKSIRSNGINQQSTKVISNNNEFNGNIKRLELYLAPLIGSVDFSLQDLVDNVQKLLLSNKSNDDLQNEMFELLGIEALETISDLLLNRSEIVSEITNPAPSNPVKKMLPVAPVYSNVIDEIINDPRSIMKRKAEALTRDPTKDMFREISTKFQAAPSTLKNCPHIYDKSIQSQQSASVLCGKKIYLPQSAIMQHNPRYELIKLEAEVKDGKSPIDIPLKQISSFDEIGKVGFQGMKELNLIQSVVFETAYGSNENMLVCAPTGAGKTNIAMLTILHQIKQFIGPGNKIKTDEFKIIYVAPMKALAAEMTANFSRRLSSLGISVRECTGDMQLTKQEITKTQMIVTTPEKYDVITRKSTGDTALVQLVKLLIIDEVHLLHEDRGSVIESIVARTLRQVESHQKVIRIVGLSATLPNYFDVATFLKVNPEKGLFFFDSRFRPVPLHQTFIGVKGENIRTFEENLNEVCYERMLEFLKKKEQVMIFVHARTETVRTAKFLRNTLKDRQNFEYMSEQLCNKAFQLSLKKAERSKDVCLKDLIRDGFGCHHAGMLRTDRSFIEQQFIAGTIRVLCCTATLAWGVNLPAHVVIIKGTQIYNAESSSFVDLGILDVLQIFGRAGRPQYDKEGHGIIMCKQDKLSHYLSLITRQNPIESNLLKSLNENLNAEIALGTVTNVPEAVRWLSYTYLYVRMSKNPLNYGLTWDDLRDDPNLMQFRGNLIVESARQLDKARMVRFDERTEYLTSTDAGRLASHYYIRFTTANQIEEEYKGTLTMEKIFQLVSRASEFSQMKVRDDELEELQHAMNSVCRIPLLQEGTTDVAGKVNILLQCYIDRYFPDSFSLVSDLNFINQNAARMARYLFERSIRCGWAMMTSKMLQICKYLEQRVWGDSTPMWHFAGELPPEVLDRIEKKNLTIDHIKTTSVRELDDIIRYGNKAKEVKALANCIPRVTVEVEVQPITRTILRLRAKISPDFRWNVRYHGTQMQTFWIWVEDPDTDVIHYSESWSISKNQVLKNETSEIVFAIPIFEPMPNMYILRIVSDTWLGSDNISSISFKHMILPEMHPPHTNLLDLRPLPVTALNNEKYQSLFPYTHFNPIQTQIFHALYHSDTNVLVGAPTGSGKTVAAELAMFRIFNIKPNKKVIYIAPLKALVRERANDWRTKFGEKLNKRVVELTGDIAPDMKAVAQADVIITTPEKWDGVSRSWQERKFVQDVALIVIDEIHLLGEDRGPVLEVIVSRVNFITASTSSPVRIVGLSTALANARDLADWLHIGTSSMGLYNFRPSVRPVPLQVHIQGFAGRHYCPRMATMNKPIYQSIQIHSPSKPVLIFVSSRRQTRLTAFDLISFVVSDDNPRQFINLSHDEIEYLLDNIRDSNLKLTLAYGIGFHHAGLQEKDRKLVENLFLNQKMQVLIATSTLAWGVNFPAHLVIVKGTEYFDGKTKRYIDYPITDVLQMMGRAGRPQFDDNGKAVIMVHDTKKEFYKKFLYEPFPVESSLLNVLPEHLNAEIVAGTISSKQSAMNYLTWTFFFRRLLMNPNYYGLEAVDHASINAFMSRLVETITTDLQKSHCVEVGDDGFTLDPGTMGRIASYYYLKHKTVRLFHQRLTLDTNLEDLLDILSSTEEFAELPVRHNEDQLNSDLAKHLPIKVNENTMDTPNTKANLLLQAHFSRENLPIADYHTDTKMVLDQAIRIVQAMIDAAGSEGWLATCLRCAQVIQMIVQGRWVTDHPLLQLPGIDSHHLGDIRDRHGNRVTNLPDLVDCVANKYGNMKTLFPHGFDKQDLDKLFNAITSYPVMELRLKVKGPMCPNVAATETDVLKPIPVTKKAATADAGNDSEEEEEEEDSLHECDLLIPDLDNGRISSWAGLGLSSRGARPRMWVPVVKDSECVLQVQLHRLNHNKRDDIPKAFAPRFPKPKDEGWILILGDPERQEVLAVRRLPMVRQAVTRVSLTFFSPERCGRCVYRLFLMSDCYLGLDQELPLFLDVHPSA